MIENMIETALEKLKSAGWRSIVALGAILLVANLLDRYFINKPEKNVENGTVK